MRWKSNYRHPENLNFIINEDLPAGFYLYIYEEPKFFFEDLNDPEKHCIKYQDNYLQDTLEFAKDDALEYFGVPMDSWVEVEEATT